MGINFIADFGRIWSGGLPGSIDTDEWHQSAGAGIWIAPFQALVIAFDYTKSLNSGENGVPFVRFGFLF